MPFSCTVSSLTCFTFISQTRHRPFPLVSLTRQFSCEVDPSADAPAASAAASSAAIDSTAAAAATGPALLFSYRSARAALAPLVVGVTKAVARDFYGIGLGMVQVCNAAFSAG